MYSVDPVRTSKTQPLLLLAVSLGGSVPPIRMLNSLCTAANIATSASMLSELFETSSSGFSTGTVSSSSVTPMSESIVCSL